MVTLRTCTACFLLSAFVLGPVTWLYMLHDKSKQVLVAAPSSKQMWAATNAEVPGKDAELPGKDTSSTRVEPVRMSSDRAEHKQQRHGKDMRSTRVEPIEWPIVMGTDGADRVVQLDDIKFTIERVNETHVGLLASMAGPNGLKQCGTTRDSSMLDKMTPDPNPEPPIVSWKYGERIALFYGDVCLKSKTLHQSVHRCRLYSFLKSPCLKGRSKNMCVFYPKSHRPCVLSQNGNITWTHLKEARYKSMIDIGTNIGVSTVLFPHFGIQVWGFDPLPENLFWLKLNRLANMVAGVTFPLHIFEGGASDRDTDVSFTDGVPGNTQIINDPKGDRKTIRRHVFRIDDHVKQPVGVFRMDCNGHEPEAFLGALELLCKYGAESIHMMYLPKAISTSSRMAANDFLDLIGQTGYELCWQEWNDVNKWMKLSLRKRPFRSLQPRDHIICHLYRLSLRQKCAVFDQQTNPEVPEYLLQYGFTRFGIERVNDTVSLIAYRSTTAGLVQCGGTRRVSRMFFGSIPDPNPEPPITSWKYGERVALTFGKLCEKHSKWIRHLMIGCNSGELDSRCTKGGPLSSMCLMFPNPAKPCHLTQDNVIMWNQMKLAKSQSMVDIGTNVGDSAILFPHWGVEVFGFDPMPQNLFWLKLNKFANKMSGVTIPLNIFEGGASDHDTDVFFTDSGSAGNTHVVQEATGDTKTVRRHVFRVDDHIKRPVGLFKMDCEGHEPEALKGSMELLCKYGAEIIQFEYMPAAMEKNSKIAPEAFLHTIRDAGYEKCSQEWFDNKWINLNLSQRFRSLNNGRDDIVCRPYSRSLRVACAQLNRTAQNR